jgi:hypothetical protein
MSEPTPKPTLHWRRAIRPLIWWSIMVLLMFAYRTHQKWSAKTHILLDPTLNGKQVWMDATAVLDEKTFGLFPSRGQRVSIGWHTLRVTHPKAKPYTTNLFIWYGVTDLGQIALERATGTLIVKATPQAQRIEIRGPEFSVTLTNTSGLTSVVPTDPYVIEASYKYWRQQNEVTVFADQSTVEDYAPKLGTLRLEVSHPDAEYQLVGSDRRLIDAGKLPTTLGELPEGEYRLISMRKSDRQSTAVTIKGGLTNAFRVEFVYGAAVVESDPAGATVYRDDHELGITPLVLPELATGEFSFSLRLNDYEPVTNAITVAANQTNSFHAKLVSRFYTRAMQRARQLYSTKEFDLAAESAAEALRYKADDADAKRVQRDARGRAQLALAETKGEQGDFAAAINAANAAVELLDESVYAKTLQADLTKREQQRIEAEKKRQAELAEQKRKQEEAELAIQRRQQSINRLNARFYQLNRSYKNDTSFIRHDLVATNAANSAATAINSALGGGQPSFEIVKYDWPQADMFTIQARHRIGIGYRECLIVGGQVAEGEMHIFYKVFEYENPPDLNLLNGFLTATSSITVTSQDPNVERRKAERFQERIKEGVKIVTERIKNASSN